MTLEKDVEKQAEELHPDLEAEATAREERYREAGSASSTNSLSGKDRHEAQKREELGGPHDNDEEGVEEEEDNGAQDDAIERVESTRTHQSARSIKSKLSKVASLGGSLARRKSKKDALPATTLPVSDLEHHVVGWEGQDDPAMPLNFAQARKWWIVFLLALMTFMTPLASSILAPAIGFMDEDFHNADIILGAFPVSIYLLGYAVGPLLLAGLSEIYGRRWVLTGSNIFFCVWQIGCALAPSLEALIVFRFLAGMGGSACITLGGSIISDLFHVHERGLALSFWIVGPLVGPSIGPVIGAFVAETIGWRWSFWLVLMPGAIATALMGIFCPETNHKALMQHKVRRLRKELGREGLRSCYDDPNSTLTKGRILLNGFVRPLKMMFLAPVLVVLSMQIAFNYGTLYLLFNTIPVVFEENYGWSLGVSGLAYIPLGLGYAVGLWVFARTSDRNIVRLTKKNDGVFEPEMRLVGTFWFAMVVPVTFFWYGWSAQYRVNSIVPIIGLFPFGFAIIGLWQPAQAYLIDAYGQAYAASALAAFSVLRSIIAAFLPLAGPSMYANLGLGWGNSLLGFICIAMIPVPVLVQRYGGYMRKKYPLKL